MALVAEFLLQLVRVLLTAAVAFAGILLGKRLRDKSDAKKAAGKKTEQ